MLGTLHTVTRFDVYLEIELKMIRNNLTLSIIRHFKFGIRRVSDNLVYKVVKRINRLGFRSTDNK